MYETWLLISFLINTITHEHVFCTSLVSRSIIGQCEASNNELEFLHLPSPVHFDPSPSPAYWISIDFPDPPPCLSPVPDYLDIRVLKITELWHQFVEFRQEKKAHSLENIMIKEIYEWKFRKFWNKMRAGTQN